MAYLFGHSQAETGRLLRQAKMFGPHTRRLFEDAGILPGMKVLDVGTGAGDVAFIVADLVETAQLLALTPMRSFWRQRADAVGLKNVTF